jgi:sugar phosphate isomerase/epimerase
MISISSDFLSDKGDPAASMKLIAAAGFKHVHWVHHWNDDFIYTKPEIDYIEGLFKRFGLSLCGVHASAGQEKKWYSELEHERLAGIEIIVNRMEMAARLSSDFIVLHAPLLACDTTKNWQQAMKSLEELKPFSRKFAVAIAIENMANDNFAGIDKAFAKHGPEFLGLCYDAGHGNIGKADGLRQLQRRSKRLLSLHLHDNNGFSDQHQLPFSGTINWEKLSGVLAKAPRKVAINLEVIQRPVETAASKEYLKRAFESAARIEAMVGKARRSSGKK